MCRHLFYIKIHTTRRFIWPATVFLGLLFTGCAIFTITPSAMRPAEPVTLALPNDITLTHIGPVDTKVLGTETILFPAGFRVDTPELIAYIDPVQVARPVTADYIFITHDHADHFSPADIERLCDEETVVIGPRGVVKKLKGYQTIKVAPGESVELDGIQIETVPMYNLGPLFLWITPHPEKADNVGYVLTVNGVRIYHAGDTSLLPALEELENITVVLIPLDEDGGGLTMEVTEAATLVNAIGPDIVVPMHYQVGEGYPERLRALVDENIRVEIME